MASKRGDVSPSEDKDLSLFDDELLFADEDDELIFADETDQAQDAEDSSLLPWKVLIVDDAKTGSSASTIITSPSLLIL